MRRDVVTVSGGALATDDGHGLPDQRRITDCA
jgi:hypothetical protein